MTDYIERRVRIDTERLRWGFFPIFLGVVFKIIIKVFAKKGAR